MFYVRPLPFFRGGGRGEGRLAKTHGNALENHTQLAVNLPVLEPHYRHPTVLQKDLSFHIIFALSRIIMNRPINFDDQLFLAQ